MKTKKKINGKKIALMLSLLVLIVWSILGASASLAWFADSTPEMNNIFHVGELDVEVSHRLTDGKWEVVDSTTKLFDDEALYEPGYVQVVYLRVDNKGDVPFNFDTAVTVNDCIAATNVLGQQFVLQDYLKFGVTTADSEEGMKNSIPDRDAAVKIANEPLHQYYETATFRLNPGESKYVALVVRMPQEVTNVANYAKPPEPMVGLGVTVKAEQIKN